MHMHTDTCTHTHRHAHLCTSWGSQTHVERLMYTAHIKRHTHTETDTCTHTYTRTNTRTHMHTCTHVHAHGPTSSDTHTHTRGRTPPPFLQTPAPEFVGKSSVNDFFGGQGRLLSTPPFARSPCSHRRGRDLQTLISASPALSVTGCRVAGAQGSSRLWGWGGCQAEWLSPPGPHRVRAGPSPA